jgi:hypothetical protein
MLGVSVAFHLTLPEVVIIFCFGGMLSRLLPILAQTVVGVPKSILD